ncbi:hypothetical protein, partial [Klebsiella pneumoniae]|uniref:hypothetical protein n=1 Tax=Klebsiella pneumoniae TaxID=573 RepID=UPI001C6E33CB
SDTLVPTTYLVDTTLSDASDYDQTVHAVRLLTKQRKHNVMLGELAIGFDFNVRSWHRADKLSELKV